MKACPNGKYYTLPVAGANSIALIYNIPMLRAANVKPPKTWAQLLTAAKALTTVGSLRDCVDL